ncbi:MAG: hypothetical protein ACREO3_03115 [Arenimonas sp.]
MTAGARPRRKWIVLGVLALLVLFGWWFVDRQLEPQRLTATVLSRLGKELKLDIAFEGTPEYAFKPEPRLQVPDIVVTDPATGKVVLRAKRLDVSLPWATIRGGDIVITRLELDHPVLDVDGLQRWLAARPEVPFKLPTLAKGARVIDGTVVGNGWTLEDLDVELPRLASGEAVDLDFSLRGKRDAVDLGARGRLHLDQALAATAYTLGADLELARETRPLAGRIDSAGRLRIGDEAFTLQADTLALHGQAPLPTLTGEAWSDKHEQLALGFRGELATWPEEWPALPPPIGAVDGPHPFIALYHGRSDFSDPLRLALAVGPAHAEVQVRVREMLAWLDAPGASPLPPLTGTVSLPQLDFEGATLRGVRVLMRDDPEIEAPSPPASP